MSLLRATQLSKGYTVGGNAVQAVRNVSLEVAAGELVALVGPSGSGKSTLLNLLGGLERPDSGRISLGDQEYGSLSEERLTVLRRRCIGYIFQSFNLVPGQTAADNVALPALLDGRRPSRQEVQKALSAVGLAHRADHRAALLSGGEQQRVAVARALLCRPPLILADEPSASLDSVTGAAIIDLLRRAAASGQAVLLVTHDPGAAALADRILYLRDGSIVGEERSSLAKGGV